MKKRFVNILFLLMGSATLLSSCKKDNETPDGQPQEESQVAIDQQYAIALFDDAFDASGESMQAVNAGARVAAGQEIPACARLTHDKDARLITLDFGTTGCTGANGVIRKGKIIIAYVGRYRELGSTLGLTFQNYTVQGNAVSGNFFLSGIVRNANDQLEYTIKVENGSVTFAEDGKTISLDLTRTQAWTAGSNTPQAIADDAYTATYTGNIISKSGINYGIATTVPLVLKVSCLSTGYYTPVVGTVEFKPQTGPAWQLDFGTGTCDQEMSLTYGPKTYPLRMR